MKRLTLFFVVCVYSTTLFSQNITNTLGSGGGLFIIKDVSNNYLTLDQSTGQVNILGTLRLENTTTPSLGVIFKGTNRFVHNFGTDNTFIGINSGNFTMTGSNNSAVGVQSLISNTDGYWNTAFGVNSLYNNLSGNQNTAIGMASLQYNTSGYDNTALGVNSLSSNTTGYQNTTVGVQSLFFNTGGYWNTAIGLNSLYSNTEGFQNTAVGLGSLQLNTTGQNNTAIGFLSLYFNTEGTHNTASGYHSLYSNTTGSYNTASGYRSLYSNTTGEANTAFGYGAGSTNTTGGLLTCLGHAAGSTITTGSNLTCLGEDAQPTTGTAINQITLGNGNITSLRCNVTTITSLSDARDKKNIKDLDLGIDFLMKIKPRQFNWDRREWYDGYKSDGSKMKGEPTAGFIAQELDEAQTTGNAEWLNLVLKDNPEKWEATPGNLLPIMVKAIQDLKKENDELKAKNAHFQAANDELKTTTVELTDRLTKFEQMQNMLVTEIEKLKTNNNESVKVSLGEK